MIFFFLSAHLIISFNHFKYLKDLPLFGSVWPLASLGSLTTSVSLSTFASLLSVLTGPCSLWLLLPPAPYPHPWPRGPWPALPAPPSESAQSPLLGKPAWLSSSCHHGTTSLLFLSPGTIIVLLLFVEFCDQCQFLSLDLVGSLMVFKLIFPLAITFPALPQGLATGRDSGKMLRST